MAYGTDSIERLVEQAEQRYRYGDFQGGVEALKLALAIEPDNGFLHSYLSFGLINLKRLFAAQHEAIIGLELEPNSAYAHYTLANLFQLKRDFDKALQHINDALILSPDNVSFLVLLSAIQLDVGQLQEAKVTLERALALAPSEPEVLGLFGDYWYELNELSKAEIYYNEALSIEPQHFSSLVGKGRTLLRNGNVIEAKEHAIWALQQQPNNSTALALLTSVKARQSPLMGIWWRINTWLVSGNNARTIVLLISAYIFFRVTSVALVDFGYGAIGTGVSLFWLVIVVYMWVGPTWFNKKLKAELETVNLDRNF
ncbi:tetratricopeptide repeat protein [Endozoicomonas sp. G2_1]|uniref:tetratricopeptide repeat protein n=1 Tax=Endozoicomonas sp. G2_1 TaxID=2821091 RepID=UPI001ADBB7F4|nr:tetratricopeptide repeat protein [Endozoicomonas sp. G2_1]MBO9489891.1 tetratricopeptide repeat protein [Endozoicomonas sp. G2_1]